MFLNFFWENHREHFFLDIKLTISETSNEILRKFVFLTMFERGKYWGKFGLFKQIFLIKQVKGINFNKNCFSPQSEPHTAKLCLSFVLKLFWGNSWKNFLFRSKSDYLRNEHRNTQKFVFLTRFEKGQILRKIWICLNNFFCSNQLKGININKNWFSPQSGPHTAK